MPIEERELPDSNQWEIKATGEDIPKVKGMLTQVGNEAYRKAFHKNEGNWERMSDPHGNPTVVPKDRIEEYRAAGYGETGDTPRMMMPEVPWAKKAVGPGRHRFRYDKTTGVMVEVT